MDLNVQAFRLVEKATSPAWHGWVELTSSRKGSIEDGAARAKLITLERRVEIARNAHVARWRRQTLVSGF